MNARYVEITAHTRLVAVLGHPIEHSLSPRMHNAAFRAQGVDMVYVALDVAAGSLPAATEGLRAFGMVGANVTLPHKETIVGLVDVVEPLAARVGAVNTVVNDDGRLIGYNTDVDGFACALRTARAGGARDLNCLVAGAGGAARAVVASLSEDGPRALWVYNRSAERALSLCESARRWGAAACEAIGEDELPERTREADLIVNATSVGLSSSVKDSAVPVDILHGGQIVMDLVYGLRPTLLVEAAAARGASAVDGREMLLMQAASSYRLWTGLEPPLDAMRKSLADEER